MKFFNINGNDFKRKKNKVSKIVKYTVKTALI